MNQAALPQRGQRPQAQEYIKNDPQIHEGLFYETNTEPVVDLDIPTTIFTGVERIAGASVPFTLEVPDDVLDEVPLGIVHGYGGVESAYAGFRNFVARNGKPAYTYDPPRYQHWWTNLHPDHLTHPDKLLGQAAWAATKGVMRTPNTGLSVSHVDLSGHSMGGPSSTSVAELKPDYIRTIIYNASAGLDGHDLKTMIKDRLPRFGVKEGLPAIINQEFVLHEIEEAKFALHALGYWVNNPYRALSEGIIVGNCDIRDRVKALSDLHIRTGIIACLDDELVSAEMTEKYMSESADEFVILPYGHLAPQKHPKEVGDAHLKILDAIHRSEKSNRPNLTIVE